MSSVPPPPTTGEGTGRYIDTDRNMFRKNLWEEVLGWHKVENYYVS